MRILEPIKNFSIRKKIFLSMLTASTVIIIAILAVTCGIIFSASMNLQTASSINDLNYISKQLDFFLTSVDNYAKTIYVNSTVQDITNKFNTRKHQFNELDRMSLKDEINKIIQNTEFIYSVNIYGLSGEIIASTEVSSDLPNLKDFESYPDLIWISSQKNSAFYRGEKVPVLMLIHRFYSYSSGKQLGYVEISIPEKSISQIYKQNFTGSDNATCIVNNKGYIESTDGLYPLYTVYPEFGAVLPEKASGYSFVKNNIVFYKHFARLDWYIISQVNRSIYQQPIYALVIISIVIALCGIIIYAVLSGKISKAITQPLYRLIDHIQKVIQGQWKPVQNLPEQNEIGYLYNRFNDMLEAQGILTQNLIKEQKAMQKLSLDLLQEQVNPHFLYNTLDNICSLAEIGKLDTLADVVMNLSKFYRETLSRGSLVIKVEDEISITQAYLNIMHIRCFGKFEFSISCPENLKKYTCLKLLLQPVVENSIYHGISQLTGSGIIKIDISEEANAIVFTVSDNGVGISEDRIKQIWHDNTGSFGLRNADQRIKLHYGAEYGLKIESGEGKGCTVTIKIAKGA